MLYLANEIAAELEIVEVVQWLSFDSEDAVIAVTWDSDGGWLESASLQFMSLLVSSLVTL